MGKESGMDVTILAKHYHVFANNMPQFFADMHPRLSNVTFHVDK